jgi:hypothetical protein
MSAAMEYDGLVWTGVQDHDDGRRTVESIVYPEEPTASVTNITFYKDGRITFTNAAGQWASTFRPQIKERTWI